MALYYYKKYTIDTAYTYDNPHYISQTGLNDVGNGWYLYASESNLGISSGTGYYYAESPRGTNYGFLGTTPVNRWVRASDYQMTLYYIYGDGISTVYESHAYFELDKTPYDVAGSYLLELIAEDGTYPTNGTQSGYWWVRQGLYTAPTAQTNAATDVTHVLATINGQMLTAGSEASSSIYFEYGETVTDNSILLGSFGAGTFEKDLSGLDPNTLYYFRIKIVNDGGTVYGSTLSFTTEEQPLAMPTITSPANETATTDTTPTFTFTLTDTPLNTATKYHARLRISKTSSMGTLEYEYESKDSQTEWEFYNVNNVKDGIFSDIGTNWALSNCGSSLSGGIVSLTGDGSSTYFRIWQYTPITAEVGGKYFLSARARARSSNCTFIHLRIYDGNAYDGITISDPNVDEWYDLKAVFEAGYAGSLRVYVFFSYASTAEQNGSVGEVDADYGFNCVDLTTIGETETDVDILAHKYPFINNTDGVVEWKPFPSDGVYPVARVRCTITSALALRTTYYWDCASYDGSDYGYSLSPAYSISFVLNVDGLLVMQIEGTEYEPFNLIVLETANGEQGFIRFEIDNIDGDNYTAINYGDDIVLGINDDFGNSEEFGGKIRGKVPSASGLQIYAILGDGILGERLIAEDWTSQDIGLTLADIIDTYCAGLTSTGIDTSLGFSAPVNADGTTPLKTFETLRREYGFMYYVDADWDVQVYLKSDIAAATTSVTYG